MRDVRIMNMATGQQIESDEVMKRLGLLEYRNMGSFTRIGLFDEGKALITSGLRVVATTGMIVSVPTGTLFQREIDVTGCVQKDSQLITMDAATGVSRTDIVEAQITSIVDKTDHARIGSITTGGSGGSVIITNEEIERDIKYYLTARKQTGTTTPTAATAGTLTGVISIPTTIDLSNEYLIHISDGEDGSWQEIDCRGATPNVTTKAEIVAAINAAVGRVMASISGNYIVLTGNGTGEGSVFTIKPPVTNADLDALYVIFGVSIGGIYKYEYKGTNSWFKLAELDIGAATTTITDGMIRNIDQKSTWSDAGADILIRDKLFKTGTVTGLDADLLDGKHSTDFPPIGSIQPYAGISVPDSSWKFCVGTAISKATYSILWGRMSSETIGTAGTGACTFTDTGDLVTCAGHGLTTGANIFFRTIVTTTGISINTNYFVIYVGADTFKVASSLELANAGTALPLTTNGTGTLTYSPFGISGADDFKIPDCRAVSLKGIGTQTINTRAKTAPVLGAVEEDQMQGHWHYGYNDSLGGGVLGTLTAGNGDRANAVTNQIKNPYTDGVNGTPRTGTTTRDNALGVNYIIKVL